MLRPVYTGDFCCGIASGSHGRFEIAVKLKQTAVPLSAVLLEAAYSLLKVHQKCYSLLRSGLPVPAVPRFPKRTKTVKRERKVPSLSDESDNSGSDEDWLPGSEDIRAQQKIIKRFIPGTV